MAARRWGVRCSRGRRRARGWRDRGRGHDCPQADQRPRARDRRRACHPVRRLCARRDAPGLRGDLGHRGRPDPRHAVAPCNERADETAAALGLPDGHFPAGECGLQSDRPAAAHAYPCAFPYRPAVAARGARDHRDSDRDTGTLGLPAVGDPGVAARCAPPVLAGAGGRVLGQAHAVWCRWPRPCPSR